MKKYDEYKDSGVSWIGEIPKDWEIKKLKYLTDLKTNKGIYGNEIYVGLENIEPFTGRYLKTEKVEIDGISVEFKCGDILFGKLRPYLAKCYIAEFNGVCSSEFLVLNSYNGYNKYIQYLLLSSNVIDAINASTYGAKMPRANWPFISQMILPNPTHDTQKSIADYLDRKTAAIDSLIEDKQKLVELLKEKRQAIISEAVTKGLDKNAKMKDSGVEWIGEVPEDWETTRFKYIFKIISGNGFREELQGKDKGEYPFLKVSDINKSEMFVYSANNYVSEIDVKQNGFNIIPPDSILIAKIGEALKKNHRKINTSKCIIDNNMEAFVPSEKINYLYAYYISVCMDMFWFDNGGTVPSINNSKLIDSVIPLPALSVQQSIVSYLMQKTAEIDNLVDNITEQIEKLKEYRQASISEAVTGKVVI